MGNVGRQMSAGKDLRGCGVLKPMAFLAIMMSPHIFDFSLTSVSSKEIIRC